MAVAVVVALLVVATLLFHFLSPWYFTPLASNWSMIDTTVNITFLVTGIVFVAVNLFMAYVIVRYRHGRVESAHYEPENTKLEVWLTTVTSVGVAAMLAPGLLVWGDFVSVPEEATDVEVVGQQWNWSFRFPGEDGVLGTSDTRHMTVDNPFGVNPEDPNGQDDILVYSPEVHLPVDEPVRLLLRSNDVLHNFTVPQFRFKMDLVPGMVTYIWVTPTATGRYEIMCEELCGVAHHAMRGRVVVDTREDFEQWLDGFPTYAETAARPAGDPTQGAAQYAVCAACHGQQGEGNPNLNSPKLTGQEGWYMERQLENFRQGIRGTNEADVYGRQMAPMAQTLADEQAIANVIAYLDTLPDNPAPETVVGDVERGADLYATCAACHGPQGEGFWTMQAPRLAGMKDWYLVTQLNNFRQGIRGGHPQDLHGSQMVRMADFLNDEQAVNDVVAYINSL